MVFLSVDKRMGHYADGFFRRKGKIGVLFGMERVDDPVSGLFERQVAPIQMACRVSAAQTDEALFKVMI